MSPEEKLNFAIGALHQALPNQGAWSGPAAMFFESRLREQIASLSAIAMGLWS